jgi:hypothetical protein
MESTMYSSSAFEEMMTHSCLCFSEWESLCIRRLMKIGTCSRETAWKVVKEFTQFNALYTQGFTVAFAAELMWKWKQNPSCVDDLRLIQQTL